MKRIESLQGLSRDHHLDLAYASRLVRWAAEAALPDELQPLTAERWTALKWHFEFEEAVLLPLTPAERRFQEMVARVRKDHADIAAAFRCLLTLLGTVPTSAASGSELRDAMRSVAHALRAHIRFEEQVLFPALQAALSDLQTAQIGAAWRGQAPRRHTMHKEVNHAQ